MRSRAGRRGAWLGAALLLLGAAVPLEEHARRRRRLWRGDAGARPAELAGTLLLAGFRGAAADVLWMRVLDLERRGRHYEMLALCEGIRRLQPQFAEVWLFGAWSMACSVAPAEETDQGRWEWIRAALAFLEEGIRRNPGNWDLLFLRGWILEHRVGPSAYCRRRVQAEFGLNHHALAIQCFRRHREFGEADVQAPYRRSAGHAYRAWAVELRQEARELAARAARAPRERALALRARARYREALARFGDARTDWASLVCDTEGRAERARFAADTRRLMDATAREIELTEKEMNELDTVLETGKGKE